MADFNDIPGLSEDDFLKVYGDLAGEKIKAGLEAVKPILRQPTPQPAPEPQPADPNAPESAPGDQQPTAAPPPGADDSQPPQAPPPHVMDIYNGPHRDTFQFGQDGETTRVGESSGYALLPAEEKQIDDIDQAMRRVQTQDDLDPQGKAHVIGELQRKRDALDPHHQYGQDSPRGRMSPAAKAVAQRVYADPHTGVHWYLGANGDLKPFEPKNLDRMHEAATAARQHQQEIALEKIKSNEALKKAQAEAAKLKGDAELKAKRQDQFLKFYDAAHKHLTTKDELKNDVPPKPEEVEKYVRKAMEFHAELTGEALPEDWKGSKEYQAKQKKAGTPSTPQPIKTPEQKASEAESIKAELERRAQADSANAAQNQAREAATRKAKSSYPWWIPKFLREGE